MRVPSSLRLLALSFIALAMLGGRVDEVRAQATTVIVVRHAEKADEPDDPTLSDEGIRRAEDLAAVVADFGIDAIYTTQYRRTRMTAASAAAARGVDVQQLPVDASNADTYADELVQRIRRDHRGSSVLVVGHSNTVPDLVRALSGHEIAEISESEYDHMFVVILPVDGQDVPRLLRARYGAPSPR